MGLNRMKLVSKILRLDFIKWKYRFAPNFSNFPSGGEGNESVD